MQPQAAADPAGGAVGRMNRKLEFVTDRSIDRLIVRVVDTKTNEVLLQVPAESMLAAARALSRGSLAGLLIDRQA